MNENYRNNPSLLVRVAARGSRPGGAVHTSIIIDCGKTFREAVLRWFPLLAPPVAGIDALVLTHEHADAMLGMVDVRGLQISPRVERCASLPVFLSEKCMARVAEAFPYLMPAKTKPMVERFVAKLSFQVAGEPEGPKNFFIPLSEGSLEFRVLPVIHGEDCTCLGFAFGRTDRVI